MAHIYPWKGVTPKIAADAFIAPTAVIIGDVEIGPKASVWFGCVLRGDVNHIRIGARTNVQDGTVIHVESPNPDAKHPGFPTIIGDDVLIGHKALVHGCTLEDRAIVGMASTLMDGVVVEQGGMVAAGALVTPGKRVLRKQLWAGRPAAYVRDVKEVEAAGFARGVASYVERGQMFIAQLIIDRDA